MKKVLLSSTALFALSGAAAFAEVTISGNAEMGIAGAYTDLELSEDVTDPDDPNETIDSLSGDLPVQFWQDVDIDFTLTGETDGGLAFGANVDLDEAGNLSQQFSNQGVDVFISGEFGTVTLGDTDGAVDFVITDQGNIGNPGSINDAETTHAGYQGAWLDGVGDGQILRYDYSFDAFTFAASVAQIPSGGNGTVVEDDDGVTWGVGVGYEFDFGGGSVDTGLGYQYSDDGAVTLSVGQTFAAALGISDDPTTGVDESQGEFLIGEGNVGMWAVGAVVNLDAGFSVGANYANYDFDDAPKNVHQWSIGAGYAFDAFSFHGNYGEYNGPGASSRGWGLSAGYDLGGGASLLAGYGDSEINDIDVTGDGEEDTFFDQTYSFGLSFSF
ncbi:MAG: porin [Paracoccaceae bacterium]|jgi:outer membrane protein OmpU|nr:porin [Paracoccaceae bacterium]